MRRNSQNQPKFQIEDGELIGEKVWNHTKYGNLGNKILTLLKNNSDFIGQIDAVTGERYTFGRMRERSIKCALWLKKLNVKSGDVITICTDNHLESYVPYLAALYIGAITNPWPKRKKAIKSNARYFLTRVTPKIIFADYDNARMIHAATLEMKVPPRIVVFCSDNFDEFECLELILNENIDEVNYTDIDKFSCARKNINDPAIILLSCSTTGFLKDVEISYTIFLKTSNHIPVTRSSHNIGLWFESFNWFISLYLTIFAIFKKMTMIKCSSFNDENQLCDIIQKYKVTWVFLETNICNQLSEFDIFQKYDISSLKMIVFGGLTIKHKVHVGLIQSLPNVFIIQVYYLPETGIIAYQRETGTIGSSGHVGRNVRLLIADFTTKEPLGPYSLGVIWCKTPSMIKGYYKDTRYIKNVFDDNGWFRSEDVGYYDETGNIFVIDRVNRMIRWRHHYISPFEIEIGLQSHPDVSEAVVVPSHHYHDNFRPVAFVKLKPGSQVKELKSMLKFINEMDDSIKLYKIFPVKELPHISKGEIDRKTLCRILDIS